MKPKKSQTSSQKSARSAFNQRASKKVHVEPLDNFIAVRYRESARKDVEEVLRSLGRVHAIEAQRLLLLELSDPNHRATALKKLQPWVDQGAIEFVTPVLRDTESQLRQILTDEITVRFKSALPSKQLKAVEQKYGVTIARQNEFVPNQFVLKVTQPEGMRTLEVASQLDDADEVEFATPNFISEYKR